MPHCQYIVYAKSLAFTHSYRQKILMFSWGGSGLPSLLSSYCHGKYIQSSSLVIGSLLPLIATPHLMSTCLLSHKRIVVSMLPLTWKGLAVINILVLIYDYKHYDLLAASYTYVPLRYTNTPYIACDVSHGVLDTP